MDIKQLNENRGHKLQHVKAAARERDELKGTQDEAEGCLSKELHMRDKNVKLKNCVHAEISSSMTRHDIIMRRQGRK